MHAFFSRRTLILVPIACAAIYGCSDTSTPEEDSIPPELADVLYEGTATDEALVSLDAAIQQKAPVADPTQAPTLDAPTATMLAKTPIPTFTWHSGMSTQFAPNHIDTPHLLRVPESTSPFRQGLAELFGPIKSAHAHGTPLTGPGVLLTFSTATNAKLARIFTSLSSYTPAQEVWDKMVAANAEITLSLVGAQFDNNRVADSGGPFQGSKFAFTITP